MSSPNIDSHPDRKAIIRDLLDGVKQAEVARRYGISTFAVSRYVRIHIPKAIKIAQHLPESVKNDLKVTSGDGLGGAMGAVDRCGSVLSILEDRQKDINEMLSTAKETKDISGWAAVARVEQSGLRLRAELTGELAAPAAQSTQIMVLMPPTLGQPAPMGAGSPTIDIEATTIDD